MDNTFKPGDKISFFQQAAAGIHMKETILVGYNDDYENPWVKRFSKLSGDIRPHRLPKGQGRVEPRFIIEHFYGWSPGNQTGFINPNLVLNPESRYSYAYKSELSPFKKK